MKILRCVDKVFPFAPPWKAENRETTLNSRSVPRDFRQSSKRSRQTCLHLQLEIIYFIHRLISLMQTVSVNIVKFNVAFKSLFESFLPSFMNNFHRFAKTCKTFYSNYYSLLPVPPYVNSLYQNSHNRKFYSHIIHPSTAHEQWAPNRSVQ